MSFSPGLPELLIILAIVILVFGVGKLPQVGGAIGQSIREFRKAQDESAAEPAKPAAEPPARES